MSSDRWRSSTSRSKAKKKVSFSNRQGSNPEKGVRTSKTVLTSMQRWSRSCLVIGSGNDPVRCSSKRSTRRRPNSLPFSLVESRGDDGQQKNKVSLDQGGLF